MKDRATEPGQKTMLPSRKKKVRLPGVERYFRGFGLYSRIARQLGVDRSYVSRVARGQRRSRQIEAALWAEVRKLNRLPLAQSYVQ